MRPKTIKRKVMKRGRKSKKFIDELTKAKNSKYDCTKDKGS